MLKHCFTIWCAKCIRFACKLAHKQGVTLAGAFALKFNPSIVTYLANQIPTTIAICGTNGKTTTNNLMALALESNHKKVLINATGSNMKNGIISALVLAAKNNGKMDVDYATLEIDEASLRHITPLIKIDYLVLTNLFRDQLDRYGEIETTINLLMQGLNYVPNCKLIINGDDVLSYQLALKSHHEFTCFGIDQAYNYSNHNDLKEGQFCFNCHTPLKYHFYHYAQLGDYYCPNCGMHHPTNNTTVQSITSIDPLHFSVDEINFNSNLKGFYNIYNHLAVIELIKQENLLIQNFADQCAQYHPAFGRLEQFNINGVNILLNLAKNPAGFNQNIDLVLNDPNPKEIIIAINDNEQDGIDVSWLWDVDFERLVSSNVTLFYTCGTRYMDMALRLKYANISCLPFENINACIDTLIADSSTHNIYVLVNYTALYPTSQHLKKRSNG